MTSSLLCSFDKAGLNLSCFDTEPICKCGKLTASKRIIEGEEVRPHSIPFQVALYLMLDDGKFLFCGGSLISPRFVVTGKLTFSYFAHTHATS